MAKKDARPAAKEDSRKSTKSSRGAASKDKATSGKPNPDGESFNAGEFVQGTQEELAKVIWPTRQQLISESAAVILMVGLSATIIYLVDNLFGWASRQIF